MLKCPRNPGVGFFFLLFFFSLTSSTTRQQTPTRTVGSAVWAAWQPPPKFLRRWFGRRVSGWREAKPPAVAVWYLRGGFRLPPAGLGFASEVREGRGGPGSRRSSWFFWSAGWLEAGEKGWRGEGGKRGGLKRGPAAVRRPAVDTSQARNANTAGALCGQVKDSLALGGFIFFLPFQSP